MTSVEIDGGMSVRVHIIGAGVAGLSLACHLQRRNIPFKIFERGSKLTGHNYGITLYLSQHNNLLQALELGHSEFIEKVAVDRLLEGNGNTSQPNEFKASDASLRELLCQTEVLFNHKLMSATSSVEGLKLSFDNGTETMANITVDASGLNSPILSSLLPNVKPSVLPYAVYHGSRYVKHDMMPEGSNEYNFQIQNYHIQVTRAVIKSEDTPSSLRDEFAPNELIFEIRYTLSRPAITNDPLFNPSRSKESAKHIPEEFYTEMSDLVENPEFPELLKAILNPSRLRQDRILNWLMRYHTLSRSEIQDLAGKGVFLIGDAAHGLPILGSEGANIAMDDAKIAADFLDSTAKFYDARMRKWEEAYEKSLAKLKKMHKEMKI